MNSVSANSTFIHNLKSNPAQLAAGSAAVGLIGASAVVGVIVGHLYGSQYGQTLGIVFAVVALAGELLKPVAVLAVWQSLRRFRFASAAVCAVVALACLSYSLAADLYLSSRVRGDMAAQRANVGDTLKDARADRKRLIAQLDDLRPATVINREIAALLRTDGANECVRIDGPISRRICSRVDALKAEQNTGAATRQRLEAQIGTATRILRDTGTRATKGDDPLATAISGYLAALGIASWKPNDVAPWLALLLPALLEIGSSFGLVVAASFSRDRAPSLAGAVVDNDQRYTGGDHDAGSGSPIGTALLTHVQRNGGAVQAGQRDLAEALGTSKSVLHRVLHQLKKEGRILLSANNRGTQIQLSREVNA